MKYNNLILLQSVNLTYIINVILKRKYAFISLFTSSKLTNCVNIILLWSFFYTIIKYLCYFLIYLSYIK